jgi:hypothetical protein
MRCMNCWASGTSWMLTMAGRPRSAQISVRQAHDLAAGLGIEARGRFIDQQKLGLLRQRARDADPLPLPARQRIGALVGLSIRPDAVEQLIGALDVGGGYFRRKLRQNGT